jgi:uncharacterized protein YegL
MERVTGNQDAETKDLAVAVILDRSGSMHGVRDDTIGAFNGFIEDLKKQEGRTNLTLVQFDSESIDVVVDAIPVAEVVDLTEETYQPRGGTPLLDAIGQTLARLEKKLEEAAWSGSVLVAIMTDGHENASEEWTFEAVKQRITELDQKKDWAFTFMGAGLEVVEQAASIGIHRGSSASYRPAGKNVRATGRSMSGQAMRWRTKTTAKHELIIDDERREMDEA